MFGKSLSHGAESGSWITKLPAKVIEMHSCSSSCIILANESGIAVVLTPFKYYFIAAAVVEASLHYFCLFSYEISLRPDGRSLSPKVGLKARRKSCISLSGSPFPVSPSDPVIDLRRPLDLLIYPICPSESLVDFRPCL